jgi:hypothetical protein
MALGLFELLILLILMTGAAVAIIGALLVLTGRLQIGNFKTCPHCAERIRQAARICRYCQREVTSGEVEHRPKGLFQ